MPLDCWCIRDKHLCHVKIKRKTNTCLASKLHVGVGTYLLVPQYIIILVEVVVPNSVTQALSHHDCLLYAGLTTLNPPYPPGINPHAFNDGIMVLGTSNQPWLLEDELRRIFTYNIHVKLPGEKAREELFRMFLQTLPHTLADDHFKCLVAKSEG